MRGQIWSIDLAVSFMIFVVTLITVFFIFNTISHDAAEQSEIAKMQDLSLEVTESLMRTPGFPLSWNASSVTVVGLAVIADRFNESNVVRDNILDTGKVLEFIQNLDYNKSNML